VVGLSLGLMLLGAAIIWAAPGWGGLTAGRIIAGVGGVVVNIVMTKMVVDWFHGREVSTALAIFINSWPIGIALALLILPPVADAAGLVAASTVIVGTIATGLILFVVFYHPPDGAAHGPGNVAVTSLPIVAIICAGLIWALYNVGLSMAFSFGPEVLVSRGWDLTRAGALISAFMIVFALFLPFGGLIADKTGQRDRVILVSLLSYFMLLALAFPVPDWTVWAVTLTVAVLFGWAAGPIMSLPSEVLSPKARTFGMGVFFVIWYAAMMIAPGIAGALAEWSGEPAITIALGAAAVGVAIGALVVFRNVARAPVDT
jgi:MFS family permease